MSTDNGAPSQLTEKHKLGLKLLHHVKLKGSVCVGEKETCKKERMGG